MFRSRLFIAAVFVGVVAVAELCLADEEPAKEESEANILASQPKTLDGAYFLETFSDPIEGRWIKSSNAMYSGNTDLKQTVAEGTQGIVGDQGLMLTGESKRYGISAPFDSQTMPGKELVFQYELKYTNPIDCAGTYLKFLEGSPELESMEEKTGYTVMFGPDKCGNTNKVHFILRFKNAKNGEYKEHHLKSPPSIKNDKLAHLYTAVLRPDNTFEIFIDQVSVKSGSLVSDEDWEIPFTPPKEIDDPTDKKPSDWVDTEEIPDPEAKKPADWDEDAPKEIEDMDQNKPDAWDEAAEGKIPDPAATKPEDWEEDDDGPWEAPLIENPACKTGCGPWKRPMKANPDYKGKWSAPMIKHPDYKGMWAAKRIENPAYYVVENPVKDLLPIGAVAIEIWVHKPKGILFDNILVVDEYAKAEQFAAATWKVRADAEKSKQRANDNAAKEAARKKRLEEGGFIVTLEEYTKMGAETFSAYPFISFPAMLLLFFLIFKFCRADKSEQEPPLRPPRAAAKPVSVNKEAASPKKDESGEDALRKRPGKGDKEEAKESNDEDSDETAKSK